MIHLISLALSFFFGFLRFGLGFIALAGIYVILPSYVVRKGTAGFRTTKIENKISLRCVQNANIFLDDCFVRDADRLPGVESFKVPPLSDIC